MHEVSVETANEGESEPLEQGTQLGTRGYVLASAFVGLAVVLEVAWVGALAYLLRAGARGAGL